jgi:3-oxoacyl-[acyl-carrier protein] reductase
MSNLEKKNIIVTGASGGIGNAIIKKLSETGANILASGTRIEKLEELKKNFEGFKDIKI